jgi:hypothetical protein
MAGVRVLGRPAVEEKKMTDRVSFAGDVIEEGRGGD